MATWFSELGDWLRNMAIMYLVLELFSRSAVAMSITMFAEYAPIFLFGPIVGVIADRWNRKRTIIVANLFRAGMMTNFLSKKVRKDRWAWNFGILNQRPIAIRENRQLKPAISYCRYTDDFVVVVKGTKAHAEEVREACREFLEDKLKLTLNMEKTHITHVNDGFVFLGHRIIRKRGARGRMRPVSSIPWEKHRRFTEKLVKQLSGDYGMNAMDLVESLNRQLSGWANFYQYTDHTATIYSKVDRTVFWKLGYWLARKYKRGLRELMRDYVRSPEKGKARIWVLQGLSYAQIMDHNSLATCLKRHAIRLE